MPLLTLGSMLKRTMCVFIDHNLATMAVSLAGTAQERPVPIQRHSLQLSKGQTMTCPATDPGHDLKYPKQERHNGQGGCFTRTMLFEHSPRQSSLERTTWETTASELISFYNILNSIS